ncbi:MAG: histidine phosphatase family protein [Verrucomicrobiota bacterium]
MESPTRLVLIRHGEVEPRYHRVFGGRIDMELSPFGHEQAAALAEYLQRIPFHAIYASPMRRVQQTLSQLVEKQNKSPIVHEDLREVDFGAWTGLSWEEVKAQYQVSAFEWLRQLESGLISEAESIDHFRERVARSLDVILRDCREQSVAVVCHGGVIRMILALLLDLPLARMSAVDIEYASMTVVNHLPAKIEVELLNFTPWRDLK